MITTDHRFFIGWSCYDPMAMMIGFNAGWPTTEAAVIPTRIAHCWGIRSSGLPKPAKVPSIPMSAIYQMKLLVPAQQGTDAASPPTRATALMRIRDRS